MKNEKDDFRNVFNIACFLHNVKFRSQKCFRNYNKLTFWNFPSKIMRFQTWNVMLSELCYRHNQLCANLVTK